MNVLLSLCSILINAGMSRMLSSDTNRARLLQVESSLGHRSSNTSRYETPLLPISRVGCAVSGGAQGELHIVRNKLSKNRRMVSSSNGLNFPKDKQLDLREVRYMIRNQTLMRSTLEGGHDDMEDMGSVEALLWSTIRRFKHEIGDADFVVLLGDTVDEPPPICERVLCFSFSSARSGARALIGFPNPSYICYAFTVMHSGDVMQSKNLVPWQHKKSKAFFIGSLTKGESQTAEEVKEQPRVRLASIAAKDPTEFEVFWTAIDMYDWEDQPGSLRKDMKVSTYNEMPKVSKVLNDAFQQEKHLTGLNLFEASPKYKYLLNIDGVTVSWRAYQLLGAESVMLLQDSNRGEFFFHDLKPWVHYVPLKHDLSDLVENIKYLKENDEVAQKIAKEARLFWMRDLNFGATQCWTREALKLAQEAASPQGITDGFKVVPRMSNEHVTRFCRKAVLD